MGDLLAVGRVTSVTMTPLQVVVRVRPVLLNERADDVAVTCSEDSTKVQVRASPTPFVRAGNRAHWWQTPWAHWWQKPFLHFWAYDAPLPCACFERYFSCLLL